MPLFILWIKNSMLHRYKYLSIRKINIHVKVLLHNLFQTISFILYGHQVIYNEPTLVSNCSIALLKSHRLNTNKEYYKAAQRFGHLCGGGAVPVLTLIESLLRAAASMPLLDPILIIQLISV